MEGFGLWLFTTHATSITTEKVRRNNLEAFLVLLRPYVLC